jgi:hypothetical protein
MAQVKHLQLLFVVLVFGKHDPLIGREPKQAEWTDAPPANRILIGDGPGINDNPLSA